MPPTGHSKLGASSAKRWLTCPGSVALSEGLPNQSSLYAREGTAAHQLAEDCLRLNKNPHEYLNSLIVVEGEEFAVTADMVDAVFAYVQAVRSLSHKLGVAPMIEQSFHLDWIDVDLWGTNDATIALPFGTLHVFDYKHGAGLPVEVEHNEQLMYYALGALGPANANNHTDVELVIVQPRAPHSDGPVRRWRISVADLFRWRDEVLAPGVKAAKQDNAPLCAGDHCRFCKALTICPEVGKEAASVAGLTASQVFGPVELPNPADLTPEQRVRVFEFAGLLSSWIDAVKKDTTERALSGHDVPGFKVVKGRGSRKWKDEATAKDELVSALGDAAFEKKILSPAKAEKALKKIGAPKDSLSDLIEVNYSKTVVPESDKRPAICIETAANVFGG